MKIYSNGDIIDKEKSAEVFEPGFLFGWGVFEPLRVYGDNIAFLDSHISRLESSLEIIGIESPKIEWEKEIRNLISINNIENAYIRITAYKKRKGTGALIYADKFAYYTDEVYNKGFTSLISSYERNTLDAGSQIKSLSYLQNRLSWFQAQKENKDEAIVLNQYGSIVGGSRSNLFIVNEGRIMTPSSDEGSFEGITREVVFDIAAKAGIEFLESKLTMEELATAEEAFITSALMEVMPLVECEDKPLGNGKPGELTLKILSEYRKIVNS
ncbi:MAG: aminotransferase class IV [Candidatus Omnitrophica bacterium]|nr:aminotransferase class IV [Candidatus Omnitrophota bacterium]